MTGAVSKLTAAASRLRDESQSIARRMVLEGVVDLVQVREQRTLYHWKGSRHHDDDHRYHDKYKL